MHARKARGGPFRGIDVWVDHVSKFLLKVRILGGLEGIDSIRLELFSAPSPLHHQMGVSGRPSHRSRALAGSPRRGLAGPADDLIYNRRVNTAFPTRPWGTDQAPDAMLLEPLRGSIHGSHACRHPLRDPLLLHAFRSPQDNLGTKRVSNGGGHIAISAADLRCVDVKSRVISKRRSTGLIIKGASYLSSSGDGISG